MRIHASFTYPSCRVVAARYKTLYYEFPKDVRLIFIPLISGRRISEEMARAAMVAYEYGDFWRFHDDLFENQNSYGTDVLRRLISNRNWNIDLFIKRAESSNVSEYLEEGMRLAKKVNICATPKIFVNGGVVENWLNVLIFRSILEEEL